MTVDDALSDSAIDSTDAEILLAAALKRDRSWLYAHGQDELDDQTMVAFAAMTERRRGGEPVAYILGQKEFYGRDFRVNQSTLVPRPATELLVEQVLNALKGEPVEPVREIDTDIVAWSELRPDASIVKTIVDIGTGSGCIAVTLACERSDLHVIATDIASEALAIAHDNAQRHNVADRIEFRSGKDLEPVADLNEPFLLVSNPPYIPEGVTLDRDVADFEPATALFAGPDGKDVLTPLIAAARNHPFCRGFFVECRKEQTS